jgi:putative phosphoribosyl transferase
VTFHDRREAGVLLARHLATRLDRAAPVVVLGIPRGGVVVAAAVAEALGAPLDIAVPRKLGAPGEPELAIGALALCGESEIVLRDERSLGVLGVSDAYVEGETARQKAEILRRLEAYREVCPAVPLQGVTALLVDDGIATGLTARAAALAIGRQGVHQVVICAPIAPAEALEGFRRDGLRIEVLAAPVWFDAVGRFYARFDAVEDDEVRALLRAHARRGPA